MGGVDDLSSYFARVNGYNVFTGDQVIHAKLGIGTDPFFPLQIVQPENDIAAHIQGVGQALALHQTKDWQGDVVDTMNIFHRSSGDGIFVAHFGGLPPGYSGPSGGNAGLNALIPYHLDTAADDYSGTVVNDRRGMTGLRIATQAPNPGVGGISVLHQGQDAALSILNQDPARPQGHGFGIYVDNHSNRPAVAVQMHSNAPGPPGVRIMDFTGTTPSYPAIGTQAGAIHLIPASAVNGNTLGITFGGILGNGVYDFNAHAGLYVQTAGAYGTKMYLATTNDYSKGAQARVIIDHAGRVGVKQMQPAAMMHLEPNGAGDRLLMLRMASGQSANPFELRDSADAVVALVGPTGAATYGAPTAGPARLNAYAAQPAIVALLAQGASGQSADLVQVKDSTSAIASRFDKSGFFMTRKKTAPADADLANSELAIWLDDSPVQTKVMFKAKDSLGRVKTASVKLG
jgi:hypothetical protein